MKAKRILYLEDNRNDYLLALSILEIESLMDEMVWASNRKDFEEVIGIQAFDLVLIDYNIPGYDGLTALRTFREINSDVPVIIISGTLGEELAIEMLKEGATDYILKQKMTRLVPAVNRALKEHREKRRRREAEEALRESEERYRQLFENDSDGVVVFDARSLRFEDANPAALILLGYGKDEFSTLTFLDITAEKEDAKDFVAGILDDFLEQGCCPINDFVRKDGTIFPGEISTGKFVSKGCTKIIGAIRDITERRLAEEKEKYLTEQLMQADKMASLGTLVSGVAHEINNPNNAIMFNSPMLREVFDDTFPILEEYNRRNCDFLLGGLEYSTLKETVDQLFDGISIGSQQIKRIVTDLKNYARPAMFEMQQEVDLNEVVGASITLLNNMIKNATSNFSVAYLPDIPKIRGNFQRLEQVVVNLLQNACQALENKKQAVTVTIFQDRANKKVCVSVKDEGIGIPSDQIKFLCDPFFTTKRDIGGTGLGLSVASRIVRDHKATLGIRSTFGAGSEFTLEVPV